MHSLFSAWVNAYSTECRLFACLGKLSAEGLLLVAEIPPNLFAALCSVRSVPWVDQTTHLGGISLLDWNPKPCERAAKSAGTEYVNLAWQGLDLFPLDFTAWILWREADESIPHANRSRAPLRGGSRLVEIYIYRITGGGLYGACVHGPCPVCGSRGGWTFTSASGAPQEIISWGVRLYGGHVSGAWAQGASDRRGGSIERRSF